MGEAKRRAFQSGAATGAPIGRGLLFGNRLKKLEGDAWSSTGTPIEDIQSAVLYWDKFAYPSNNVHHEGIVWEDTLIREGILLRPRVQLVGGIRGRDIVDWVAKTQLLEFEKIEKAQPNFWCLNATSADYMESSPGFQEGRSALVELSGSLPLPPINAPIDTLLEFKRKRLPELARLRASLDEIYLKIVASSDQSIAMQVAVRELDQSIADLQRTSKEWWKIIKISDTKTLVSLGYYGIPTAGLAFMMPAASVIAGGAGALLSIANGIKSKRKTDRSSPYWYAVSVSRELG